MLFYFRNGQINQILLTFFGNEVYYIGKEDLSFLGASGNIPLAIWILGQMLKPRNRPLTNVAVLLVVLITIMPILLAQRLTAGAADTEGKQ